MPALPQQDEAATAPVAPPAPVPEEAPKPTVQPPPETTAAAPPAPVPQEAPKPTVQPPPETTAAAPPAAKPLQDAAAVRLASAASARVAPDAIEFAPGLTDLPSGSQAVLDAVAAKLAADDALRLQLVAHATGTDAQAVDARRVSLARAVAVRAYLIDKGVRSLRMDVRAVGNRAYGGPATDQVDLVIVSR